MAPTITTSTRARTTVRLAPPLQGRASLECPSAGGPKVLWRLGSGRELASLMRKQLDRLRMIPAWRPTVREQVPVVKG
jgi:hypothetical protein